MDCIKYYVDCCTKNLKYNYENFTKKPNAYWC
ncbi:MAG: hypothetical protein JWR38_4089 [Mucilaginibacter sp.]|nr:hypothetical protein [Mucilaginibacter sp.]